MLSIKPVLDLSELCFISLGNLPWLNMSIDFPKLQPIHWSNSTEVIVAASSFFVVSFIISCASLSPSKFLSLFLQVLHPDEESH